MGDEGGSASLPDLAALTQASLNEQTTGAHCVLTCKRACTPLPCHLPLPLPHSKANGVPGSGWGFSYKSPQCGQSSPQQGPTPGLDQEPPDGGRRMVHTHMSVRFHARREPELPDFKRAQTTDLTSSLQGLSCKGPALPLTPYLGSPSHISPSSCLSEQEEDSNRRLVLIISQ